MLDEQMSEATLDGINFTNKGGDRSALKEKLGQTLTVLTALACTAAVLHLTRRGRAQVAYPQGGTAMAAYHGSGIEPNSCTMLYDIGDNGSTLGDASTPSNSIKLYSRACYCDKGKPRLRDILVQEDDLLAELADTMAPHDEFVDHGSGMAYVCIFSDSNCL